MDDRAAAVQDAIDAAEAVNKRADEKMASYSKRIANVEEEGREIIKASKQQADAQAQIIIEEARKQASDIIAKAERTIEQERLAATEEMRKEIASIAMLAAEQIVGKEIDNVGQDAIIDQVIEDARSAKWQN
jgi:F-type H+-transporting ATPase subunit b